MGNILPRIQKVKLTLVLNLFFSCLVLAAETKTPVNEQVNPPTTLKQRLIQRNIEISKWFDGVADGIDLFLVGKRVTKEQNKTRVTVENITNSLESHSLKNNTSLGVYPRFPNLEKYWALKFTTYDEKVDSRNIKNSYINQAPRRKNYGATAAWYRKFGDIRTSFEPRIELEDPLRISHSLAFESVANYENYEFNPKLEFYAHARRGPGFFEALNFHYFLGKRWTLTVINEGDYQDKTHFFSVNNGFSLANVASKKTIVSYAFIVNSINRPNYHLDSYVASVSYNEWVYKRIFDYTITPYLQFLRAESFRGQIGASLNLRLSF